MRLLLDTHVVIWVLTQSKVIPARVASLLENSSTFVSVVALWEIAIKSSLERRSVPAIDAARLAAMCNAAGFDMLPVTLPHVLAVPALPALHGDPFDRLMVAQAKTEPMRLVTHDKAVAAYDDNFISW